MRLQTGEQWEKLTKSLLVFPLARFDAMLQFKLTQDREEIALGSDKQTIVVRVIQEYQTRNQVERLLQAAREFNPTDPTFQQLMQEFGFATQVAMVADESGDPQAVPGGNFEALVTGFPLFDPQVLRQKMCETEPCICRVEDETIMPKGIGTGFLVAPNLILTNNHVVKNRSMTNLRVRFDYAVSGGGGTLEGVVYEVEALVDSSPHSVFDGQVEPQGEPSDQELDFALVRVKGKPGDDPIGGPASLAEPQRPPRGFVPMGQIEPGYAPNAPLLIYQHPQGGAMKLAIDPAGIIGLNQSKTRLRYRTNTEKGSSGSPCFDANMNLIALHHAGDPAHYLGGQKPKFNQGIPIGLIWNRVKNLIA